MIENQILLGIIGGQEIIIILIIVLLLFGGRKIPELMRGLGKGLKEFRDASSGKSSDKDVNEKKEESKDTDK
ncbi:MAG: twin-arginine translocase TatA/TatE family subunit [Bacteroidales bacterium]|nr:twin-arginine translocase TatA/TatE family subunit [Bacteroidales bacterium]